MITRITEQIIQVVPTFTSVDEIFTFNNGRSL